MQALKNIFSHSTVILTYLFFLFCVSVFFLNLFYDFNELLFLIETLLLILFLSVVVLRYKTILLYSLAALVPVSVPFSLGTAKLSFPSEIICVMLGGFFIVKILTGSRIKREFLFHPITILVCADLLWMFVASCASESPLVSFKRFTIRFLYYTCFYYFFFELFRLSKKNIPGIYLVQCIAILLPVISAVQFHYYLGFTPSGAQLASAPFYNDHTMYGAALVFFIPFLFSKTFYRGKRYSRPLGALLLTIFIIAAYLSFSRAAWLSLFVAGMAGVILYLQISWKWIALALSVLMIVLVAKPSVVTEQFAENKEVSRKDASAHFKSISNVNTDASNKERINRWKAALRMFAEKPIFGFGPGTYQFFYGNYQSRSDMTSISTFQGNKGHAHSEYLNYLSETGIPGLGIFLALVFTVIYKAVQIIRRNRKNEDGRMTMFVLCGLVTFFVHGFFNGFIEFDKIALPVFCSYAAICFLDLNTGKTEKEVRRV